MLAQPTNLPESSTKNISGYKNFHDSNMGDASANIGSVGRINVLSDKKRVGVASSQIEQVSPGLKSFYPVRAKCFHEKVNPTKPSQTQPSASAPLLVTPPPKKKTIQPTNQPNLSPDIKSSIRANNKHIRDSTRDHDNDESSDKFNKPE